MFFIVAALFLLLLCLCKRLSRTAFAVVEGAPVSSGYLCSTGPIFRIWFTAPSPYGS